VSVDKKVLIFSGFNQRAVVSFMRTLERQGIDYAVIALSSEDSIFETAYRSRVMAIRKSTKLDLDDFLETIRTVRMKFKREELLIAPSSEALNRFLLQNRESFESMGCVIPLVDEELYLKISDKYNFCALCRDEGISVPKECDIDSIREFPVVAKPKEYFSRNRGAYIVPVIIKNEEELDEFRRNSDLDDYFFQEYVGGRSLYLLYYFYRDGRVKKFSQENLIQQPGGKSIIAAVSSGFHDDPESNAYESLLRKLKFSGLVMIEVKQYEGVNYMIEANPRFWGPSQLFVDAGRNLFEAFLDDWGFEVMDASETDRKKVEFTRYFWFGGMLSTLRVGESLVFHNYSAEKFSDELPLWMNADVYRREDTLGIFIRELGVGKWKR